MKGRPRKMEANQADAVLGRHDLDDLTADDPKDTKT